MILLWLLLIPFLAGPWPSSFEDDLQWRLLTWWPSLLYFFWLR